MIPPPRRASLTHCKATSPVPLGVTGHRVRSWDTALAPLLQAAVLDADPMFGGTLPVPGIYTPTLSQGCSPLPSWLHPSTQPGAEPNLPCCGLSPLPSAHCPPTTGTPQSSMHRAEVWEQTPAAKEQLVSTRHRPLNPCVGLAASAGSQLMPRAPCRKRTAGSGSAKPFIWSSDAGQAHG